MPVNLLPIFAIAALLWVFVAWRLARWRVSACIVYLAATIAVSIYVSSSTNVREQHLHTMSYVISEFGGQKVMMLKNESGQEFSIWESETIKRFSASDHGAAVVSWTGWYDFGKLRGYNIQSIEPK